jgi:crotonobetainyl-CoA:carnitine CoA-transferase CaiB-like acyl-CoA transferase
MNGPLAGIRVIDLTINVLGPLCAQILGDMGAEVIKIETPDGDPMRSSGPSNNPGMASLFMNTNRNKRSVILNLKTIAGIEALYRLSEKADVFIHSLRPQAAERLGISYSAIKQRNENIIYAYAPGYKPDGPNRNRPAFDDVIQGESGIAGMNGRNTGEPRYIPMIIADKFCGNVLASAIGMALFSRERTGNGQEVVVPMMETMLSFNLVEHLWTDFFSDSQKDLGYSRMFSPHRKPYATKDGHICMLAVSDDQWRRLFKVIGHPELVSDERFSDLQSRTKNINKLYSILAGSVTTKTTSEWQRILDEADLPNGAVTTFEEMKSSKYLSETKFFHHYQHPSEGDMVTTSIPVSFSETPGSIRLPPPRLGEHTELVLQEIGYTDIEIKALNQY